MRKVRRHRLDVGGLAVNVRMQGKMPTPGRCRPTARCCAQTLVPKLHLGKHHVSAKLYFASVAPTLESHMRRILLLIAGCALSHSALAAETHDDSFTKEGLIKADASTLKDTQLVPDVGAPLDPAKNVLWCGTLQLAWNEAVALIGAPIHLRISSPEAEALNLSAFNRTDLDPASYVAIADFEHNDVEDKIRAALEKVFHGAASPELIPPKPENPSPRDFVAYAYLFKNLVFGTAFKIERFEFEGKRVEGFGYSREAGEALNAQVGIYDYQSPDDFIVKLQTTSPEDELILAKVAPGATLAETSASVLRRMAAQPVENAGPLTYLDVPNLNFDLRRDFPELEGDTVPDPKAKIPGSLVIKTVKQLVRFQLNKNGAVLKSEAVVMVTAAALPMPLPTKPLVFDQPFLILLKQKDSAQPYFALWIGNPSLLMATKADAED